ncbi:heterogeneous nuclear ribonucleoprotein 27C-like [Sycon ciliatum]|uniref:heterogeneous nuclear ribonucleoprotein 27C-like n=1 Tax=Sycon ciliatum TaxID=27933 RepID=UPI0020AA8A46|eukprot:scpid65994/ scgid31195/ Heterogeneous nuclear ribonucleoprotein 27C; HRP48.1; hnRNP 48
MAQSAPFERKKIFVGGLSHSSNNDSLRAYFERFGEVTDVFMSKNVETGTARGFAFVSFAEDETIDKLIAAAPHNVDGKVVDAKRATIRTPRGPGGPGGPSGPGGFQRGPPGQGQGQGQFGGHGGGFGGPGAGPRPQGPKKTNEKQVFVGGVPNGTTKEDLQQFFNQYGPVESAVLMVDRETGRSRGFGFVNFTFMETVDKVLGIQHFELNGKPVEVKKAERRTTKPPAGQGAPPYNMGHDASGMMDPSQQQHHQQQQYHQQQWNQQVPQAGHMPDQYQQQQPQQYPGYDAYGNQYQQQQYGAANGQYQQQPPQQQQQQPSQQQQQQQQGYNPQAQYGQQQYNPVPTQQATPQGQYAGQQAQAPAAQQAYQAAGYGTSVNPATVGQATANQMVGNPSDPYNQATQAAGNGVQGTAVAQGHYAYQAAAGYNAVPAQAAAGAAAYNGAAAPAQGAAGYGQMAAAGATAGSNTGQYAQAAPAAGAPAAHTAGVPAQAGAAAAPQSTGGYPTAGHAAQASSGVADPSAASAAYNAQWSTAANPAAAAGYPTPAAAATGYAPQ